MDQQEAIIEEIKKEVQAKLIKEKSESGDIADVLKYVAPGTGLRAAIDGILKAKTGALIVIENDDVPPIVDGGFKVNCRFTSQRMIELSKMDGAMVLSKDMKRILYANALLTPNNSIPSNETGTRHKAGERSAKQAKTLVIAISQRRDEISLFYKNTKYIVHNSNEVIRRAMEVLQILEKHKEIFDKVQDELEDGEINSSQSFNQALLLVQKGKMILKISETLKKQIIELGVEGTIVKSRLKEILYNVEKEMQHVIKDYSSLGLYRSNRALNMLSYDDLLEIDKIKSSIGISSENGAPLPKGYRFLSKMGFTEKERGLLIKEFKNLPAILSAQESQIYKIFEDRAPEIYEKISKISLMRY